MSGVTDYAGLDLDPAHAKLIADSAISAPVAIARNYRTLRRKSDLEFLGFGRAQRLVPGLLVPICNVAGEVVTFQFRPDQPRAGKGGRLIKYETPANTRPVLDVPRACRPILGDPARPLVLTEGARKVDSATSAAIYCIGVTGVYGFRGRNALGGLTALGDWEAIAFKAVDGTPRDFYLCFDSDVTTKREVDAALRRLKAYIESRGGRVFIIYLPGGPAGEKVGLDDYIASGHTAADVFALAEDALRAPPAADAKSSGILAEAGEYREREDGIYRVRIVEGAEVEDRLTNFRARIIAEIARDDGQESQSALEIEARIGQRTITFRLPAHRFGAMNWPMEHLGGGAVVSAGFGARDHARAAIQMFSRGIERRRVFVHLGWADIDGSRAYIHGAGAVGTEGTLPAVDMDLPRDLTRYALPDPPEGKALTEAVRASFLPLLTFPWVRDEAEGAAFGAPTARTASNGPTQSCQDPYVFDQPEPSLLPTPHPRWGVGRRERTTRTAHLRASGEPIRRSCGPNPQKLSESLFSHLEGGGAADHRPASLRCLPRAARALRLLAPSLRGHGRREVGDRRPFRAALWPGAGS